MAGAESVFLGLAKEQFGLILGIGVGEALAAALEPQVVAIRQAEYRGDPLVAVDPVTAAAVVAEAVELLEWGAAEALNHGIDGDRFAAIVGEVLNAPGLGELLRMLRRGTITPDDFLHGLRKSKYEGRWDNAVDDLQHERLDPAAVAIGVQRTLLPNVGILPGQPSTEGSNVPPMPMVDLDPLEEWKAQGISPERGELLARIVGLPASNDLAARMLFRKIITEGAYNQAILEGNTRGEWAPFLLDGFREILTAGEYVERQLRGFTDRAGRLADTAKHGMSPEDSDKLYQVLGRAPGVHLVVQGLARGGKYPGSYANVPEPYRSALQRANIREEWSEIEYAARYTYPSPFVLRSLAQAGDLGDAAAVEQILREIGWKPSLAAEVSLKWAPAGTTVKGDPHVAKAETQLWTRLHSSVIAGETDDATAAGVLATLQVADTAGVLALWDAERALIRKQLSPSDIRKALNHGVPNPATGVAWTVQDARAALLARGYDLADATVYLEE